MQNQWPSVSNPLIVAIGLSLAAIATLATPAPAASVERVSQGTVSVSPEFLRYWKSGLAELSSYAVTEERYGEMRKAQGVLVFVYEEINADSRIKVETDKTPIPRRIPVLKLNNVLKFTTGIYDYSIMTSVFAGLSGPYVHREFEPLKISFSSQEWCGNVFHQLLPRTSGLISEIHSYFEAEGDATTTLPYPAGPLYFEDEMPILVRELDGESMKAGEAEKIHLVPGLWERRKRHDDLAITEGVFTKVGAGSMAWRGGETKIVKWTLVFRGVTTTYFVEAVFPRKLLLWENSRGEKGELINSIRKPYWTLHGNKDQSLRKELGLSYGVGSGD